MDYYYFEDRQRKRELENLTLKADRERGTLASEASETKGVGLSVKVGLRSDV